jgi:hypothetical protein
MPGWESPSNTVARRFPESPGFSHGEVQLATSRMDGEAWNEKLEVLEEHVEDHIEEEEGDIFDVARQLFSVAQAAELAQRWQMAKQEYMARHAK